MNRCSLRAFEKTCNRYDKGRAYPIVVASLLLWGGFSWQLIIHIFSPTPQILGFLSSSTDTVFPWGMCNPSPPWQVGAVFCGSLSLFMLGLCAVGTCWRWLVHTNPATHSPFSSGGRTLATDLSLVLTVQRERALESVNCLYSELPRQAGAFQLHPPAPTGHLALWQSCEYSLIHAGSEWPL